MGYPVIFQLGSLQVHAHLVFEVLAYTIGFRFYLWSRKRSIDALTDSDRIYIFIAALAGGFLGSHLLGMLEHPFELRDAFVTFIANKTVVGGLLGGLIAVEITKKLIGVTKSSGDLMTYPLILAMIIGRIGCHLHGLDDSTVGMQSSLPWSIDFGDGITRHPVNLYEICFLLLLAAGIAVVQKNRPLPDGARFKIFMFCYLLWRFMVEFIKPVHVWIPIGLSSIQIACLAGLVYYQMNAFKARLHSEA